MAFNSFGLDTGVEDFSGGAASEEERKRRMAMLANMATGGTFGDALGQYATNRATQATDRFDQIGQAIENPEDAVRKRFGMQSTQPVGPVMPEQIAQERQPLPGQTPQEQQLTTPQFQAQQAQMGPVNPTEVQQAQNVELPKPGEGVQVAGTQPGMGVSQAANQQPSGLGLKAPSKDQQYVDQFNSGDIYSLANKNSGAPEYIKTAAQDQLLNTLKQDQIKKETEDRVNRAGQDPQQLMKLFDEFKRSKSEDGSYVRAYLLNRFGFKDAAESEMNKLGWGAKYVHTKVGDEDAMIKYTANGEPISGITSSGKKLSASELIGTEIPSKTSMYTGGSKIFSIPKGDANEGQEYTARFNTHTGKYENIITTGPNAGKQYTGAPGLEKRVETQAAITENKLESSKGLIDYRLQQNLKYAGPMAYTKAGAAYVGRYNAENGTSLGYNREGVLVDHNNNNKPVVQNKDGSIEAVQRVEKPATAPAANQPPRAESLPGGGVKITAGGAAPAAAATAPAAAATAPAGTNAPPDLTKPPPYNPAMSPRENQKAQDNWAAVQKKTRQDFTTGPQGKTVTAMNTAVAHLDTLNEAGTALYQGQIPVANKVVKEFSTQLGLPEYTNFEGIKHVVGTEVAKAVSGSGQTALADRQAIEKEFDSANSPDQLKGIIKKYQELMGGQLKSQKQTWTGAGLHPDEFDNKLLPRTRKVINETEAPTRSKW